MVWAGVGFVSNLPPKRAVDDDADAAFPTGHLLGPISAPPHPLSLNEVRGSVVNIHPNPEDLGKLPPWGPSCPVLTLIGLMRSHVDLVQVVQGQLQEIMLVLPGYLRLREAFASGRSRRRVGNLGDEVRRRCLSHAVHQNTDEGCLQNNRECESKAKQNTFTVGKPAALLVGGELHPAEVRFQLQIISDVSKPFAKSHSQVRASDCGRRNTYAGI